ncbi:response regulator transcription factor [Bacillus gaemokensis]|uniref:AraC family transcriptional regulator n=1 Tax=Bacillus gaemokensis TaxID=574375 RepID=A0A073KGN2_9BACI|nr:response regulator [Bacillus gaemokensis]KEK26414.1 AraC family transcriptional regulator [Bacillus gaemokensis]KYG39217.1 AraC family transcriptional regulator [Bacillus gaemokensis]
MKRIKVLIADDETIVRKGLKMAIDWAAYNMEVVADVPNGERGWEEFVKHEPEVIITDIVMPVVNGIEFVKRVKQRAPKTKVLLLSCHRDFEYAQEGIKLGVSGYLLKTLLHDEELDQYLREFQQGLTVHREVEEMGHQKHPFYEEFFQWMCGFQNQFQEVLEGLFRNEWSWMSDGYYACFIRSESRLHLILKDIDRKVPNVYIKILCGKDQCFLFLNERNEEMVEQIFIDLKSKYEELYWITSRELSSVEQWMDSVKSMKQFAELEIKYKVTIKNWPKTIKEAILYTMNHLSEPIVVSEVAEMVGLSRSHFSTLFKKVIGESFHSFTERRKLELAMQMLQTTSLTIQEVAEHIGITNSKYFSKWFKKCTGTTPSEYRDKQYETLYKTN